MITPKQRAELKGYANSLPCAFQIGKGGLNENQVAQIDDYSAREAAEEIAQKINADVVQVIGSKAVLYKPNPKDPVIKLKNK